MPSFLETAVTIAREAGAVLRDFHHRGVTFELKGAFDLVTAADRASERLIVDRLREHFPEHSVLAEEGMGADRQSDYCWYVDPLDGTTNFAHGFPFFAVTMGLERNGEMIAGVTYDPLRDELYTAERGAGAFRNGQKLSVSPVREMENSLSSTGFPSRKRHHNINVYFYHQLAMLSHGVRRTGSAALDLASVASGRIEAFWEFGLQPWDMAAGILLVREAGGRVSDMKGQPWHLRGEHLLASNHSLHAEIVTLFNEIFAGHQRVPMPPIPPAAA